MNRLTIGITTILLIVFYSATFGQNDPLDQKVTELLKKMTLEEKVGQMTQITLEVVSKPRTDGSFVNELDMEKLRDAIVNYKIGSIINTGGQANTVQNWQEIITAMQDVALKETRLAIPVIYGIDAIHGANYTQGATLFPQSITMAATFNTQLAKEEGRITALEVRACGIPWNFNPVLGVARNPLWPRFWETYGEDPYLVSMMGESYIKGLEGDENERTGERVAACMKHYLGYSFPLNGRDRTPAWIPERMMRDIFLPSFKKAVEAGVQTVMVNSSEINGIPVHSDHYLLTEVLKDELGFKGFVVSDWEDIVRLYTRDRVAETPEEAVRMAVMAGMDMSMVPYNFSFYEILVKLVKDGKVPVSRIDDAVSRILRVKFQTDLFGYPYPDKTLTEKFASQEAAKINLLAAREAITLLKNNKNTLPLKKDIKILVTGPTANKLSVLNSGWSVTWQGNQNELYPQEKFTVVEAVQQKIGAENVEYIPGTDFTNEIDINKAAEGAGKADAIIICLGEDAYCESPGSINDLSLPDAQLKLAKEIYKSAKPVILVLIEGRPRVINRISGKADAIVMAYLPGLEGANAIADVIFGDVNPSGKLPFTYPNSPNGFVTYDHKPLEEFDVNSYENEFPFGHGLSYTTFEYSGLTLNSKQFYKDEIIEVSVTVKNTGKRTGKESVLLYGTDLVGSVSRPVKQLKRFEKIELNPGEQKEVTFTLSGEDFAFTGRDNKKIIEPGTCQVSVAGLTETFQILN